MDELQGAIGVVIIVLVLPLIFAADILIGFKGVFWVLVSYIIMNISFCWFQLDFHDYFKQGYSNAKTLTKWRICQAYSVW